ncbi:MAG: hypothetical protein KIC66_15680 [Clostridium sp.]|uniref:hypothetical protein n=1 Tax=Clostridium sp. TaxID=1506 RepID=UPI0034529EC9|nr:hypothetical protein [Clostridium sp.]
MYYNEEKDFYTYRNGKQLNVESVKFRNSKTGYKSEKSSEKSIYICEDCSNCTYKNSCIKKNVLAESILLAMAHNINKLHSKIQGNCTGKHLFDFKKSA